MISLTDHASLTEDQLALLAAELAGLETLERVIQWGLALPTERTFVDVIVQDEYCHDAVMEWDAGLFLAFDTT